MMSTVILQHHHTEAEERRIREAALDETDRGLVSCERSAVNMSELGRARRRRLAVTQDGDTNSER